MSNVPTLQTAADLTASQIAGAASALLPSGVVLPYAGTAAPTGWLLCNGQEISQATYADLYAVLTTTYNLQTDPTTGIAYLAPTAGTFRVPDYRGSFLRGVGTPSVGDTVTLGGHQVHKTAKNGLGATTSGTDGTHTHNATANSPATVGTSFFDRSSGSFPTGSQPVVPSSGSGHGHAITITGDNETRPVNKGVNYIIKA